MTLPRGWKLDASGKSAAAFARERGLAPRKLHSALNKRNGKRRWSRARTAGSPLVPVHVVRDAERTDTDRARAAGRDVPIPAGFDEVALRRVIDVRSMLSFPPSPWVRIVVGREAALRARQQDPVCRASKEVASILPNWASSGCRGRG